MRKISQSCQFDLKILEVGKLDFVHQFCQQKSVHAKSFSVVSTGQDNGIKLSSGEDSMKAIVAHKW